MKTKISVKLGGVPAVITEEGVDCKNPRVKLVLESFLESGINGNPEDGFCPVLVETFGSKFELVDVTEPKGAIY